MFDEKIKKQDVYERVLQRPIQNKAWRSAAEDAVKAYLAKEDRSHWVEISAEIRRRYDEAGAGFSGRWQS